VRHRPALTIGLPVYNGDDYLQIALDSVQAQSFTDWELVLADNASTDGTADICRAAAAADRRIRYLPSPTNRGSAWNWNRCVAEAAAPRFQWLCHDDALACKSAAHLLAALDAAGPDVVGAYPDAALIDAHGEVTGPYPDPLDLTAGDPHRRLESIMTGLVLINPLFGVFRTDVLKSTRLMQGFARADTVLLVELFLRGRAVKVDEELFLRRRHDEASMVSHTTAGGLDRFYDTSRSGTVQFPTWRLIAAYGRAVWEAPLSPTDRARCTAILGKSRYRRHLWRELRHAASTAFSLPFCGQKRRR
jgi:glycosyltransferase involved in cell wall biosynthesis